MIRKGIWLEKTTSKSSTLGQCQLDTHDVRMKKYEEKGGEILNSKYEYYMPKSVQPEFRQQ